MTALLRSLATPKVDRRANAIVRLPSHAAACVLASSWRSPQSKYTHTKEPIAQPDAVLIASRLVLPVWKYSITLTIWAEEREKERERERERAEADGDGEGEIR